MTEPGKSPSSRRNVLFGTAALYLGLISLGAGLYYGYLTAVLVGLALIALGIGVHSLTSVRASSGRMRALANFVFHEKIAIIDSYRGNQKEQLGHDRQAALELAEWVEPELRQEFEDLWQDFFQSGIKPIVVKIGGSTLGNQDTTIRDLVTLQKRGVLPVVVHGGGNRVTEWLDRMGLSTRFVRGSRVTDGETLQVVTAVLTGLVNKELVAAVNSAGGKAVGLSGIDGALIEGKISSPEMGYMGDVVKVNPDAVIAILGAGYMPIIATGGYRPPGDDKDPVTLLNINADASASEIALALGADRLIYLTDVPGVLDRAGKLLPRLSAAEARSLIDTEVVSGGMIPKVEGCLRALAAVSSTQIIDGRSEGALLASTEGEGGTTIE